MIRERSPYIRAIAERLWAMSPLYNPDAKVPDAYVKAARDLTAMYERANGGRSIELLFETLRQAGKVQDEGAGFVNLASHLLVRMALGLNANADGAMDLAWAHGARLNVPGFKIEVVNGRLRWDEGPLRYSAAAPPPRAPARPTPASPSALPTTEALAATILSEIENIPTGPRFRYGDDKVFISAIWDEVGPHYPGLSRADFDRLLLQANRERRLSLARADMPHWMDAATVQRSEVNNAGASFHFVLDEDVEARRKAKAPPRAAAAPPSVEALVATVREVLPGIGPNFRFGRKVFLSAVWDAVRDRYPTMTRRQFDELMVAANRMNALQLARADLIGAMDPRLVKESEIALNTEFGRGTEYHFVKEFDDEQDRADTKDNRAALDRADRKKLDRFVNIVKEVIPTLGSDAWFGDRKVFIGPVRDLTLAAFTGLTVDQFERLLRLASRENLLVTARADLVSAMDSNMVERSETKLDPDYPKAVAHFIITDGFARRPADAPPSRAAEPETFAERLIAVLPNVAARERSGSKTFISGAWRAFHEAYPSVPYAVFRGDLLRANREGELQLSRCDLQGAFPGDVVNASRITDYNADFHFVEPPPQRRGRLKRNPCSCDGERPQESFTAMDARGRVIGTARSVSEAMRLAPDDESYVTVRGEYTSDGTHWGAGRGRIVATREFNQTGGFRWYRF